MAVYTLEIYYNNSVLEFAEERFYLDNQRKTVHHVDTKEERYELPVQFWVPVSNSKADAAWRPHHLGERKTNKVLRGATSYRFVEMQRIIRRVIHC